MKQQAHYQKGDKIGNRYQVHQALMGGMGEVYLCLDLEQMVPVALKTFQRRYLEQAPGLRRAFEKEVLAWVALEKHPNIVRCFFMDTLDNQPFMVLEWVGGEKGKGVDLRGWLRQGPLGLRQALDFTIDICYGLAHAQQKQPGMVHRDLKPENILIAQGGLAKITDFGLAQIVVQASLEVNGLVMPEDSAATYPQQSLAAQGGVAGTPPYMPPEQWQPGAILDERADIYALGCILVEMLIGRPPFAVGFHPTTSETYQRWLNAWQWQHEYADRPVFPSAIPAQLAELLASCLAQNPEVRPQSATDLLNGLQQVYRQLLGHSPRPIPVPDEFSFVDYNSRGATYDTLGQYEKALADYAQAIRLNPAYAIAYNNRGNTYQDLGRSEEALTDYAQAIRLNPADAMAYNNRGTTYKDLGRFEEALADYAQAIRLNPADANVYFNRGVTYKDLGRSEEALADYAQAIRLNPTDIAAFYNRGNTYQSLGRYEEALADYNQVIRLNPADLAAFYNRGITYRYLGRYEEALADFAQAIRLDPLDAGAFYNRGITYQTLGRSEEALADYAQAIRLDPVDARAFYNRGFMYQALGRYEEALADFAQAIRLNPADAQTYNNRGVTYQALGRSEEALADYAQAIRLNPANAKVYFNCGTLMVNTGQLRESLPYFEKAVQLGHTRAAQAAAKVRQMLGETPSVMDPAQQMFEAFQQAASLSAMAQAVAQYPFMVDEAFMAAVEQAVNQQVPPEHRPAFEQRLTWLRQIAAKQ